MNNKKLLACLMMFITLLFPAFRAPVVSEKYVVDKKESLVTWKGSMALASKGQHVGYVYFSKGDLILEKGQLTGGSFEIDMNTITDPVHGSDNNLIQHLKDPDFFDVVKFPATTFIISKVKAATGSAIDITGNLTIKGITHEVTFPAQLELIGGVVNASGKLNIDRSKWDVRYGSATFFNNLADDTISNEIEFDIKIVARK